MILEFSVTNFRSIAEEQFISFEPAPTVRGSAALKRSVKKHGVLPVVVAFGANGAGKSTIAGAFGVLRQATMSRTPDEAIVADPFMLPKSNDPIEISVKLRVDHTIFRYLFALSEGGRFEREELSKVENGEWVTVFERDGIAVKPALDDAALNDLHPSISLLAHLAARRSGDARKVTRALRTQMVRAQDTIGLAGHPRSPDAHEDFWGRTFRMIQRADVGISAGMLHEREGRKPAPRFTHTGTDGGSHELPMNAESDGTMTVVGISSYVWGTLGAGGMLVIDELGANLNHWMVRDLIETFQSPELNPHGAQLLLTSHDPLLLNEKILRTDQMVMIDKDTRGASQLSAVSDFTDLPPGKILQSYLEGRLGGSPRFRNLWANLSPATKVAEDTAAGEPL